VQQTSLANCRGGKVQKEGTVDAVIDLLKVGRTRGGLSSYGIDAVFDTRSDLVEMLVNLREGTRSFLEGTMRNVVVPFWRFGLLDVRLVSTFYSIFGRQGSSGSRDV